jgi:hypothetical protein
MSSVIYSQSARAEAREASLYHGTLLQMHGHIHTVGNEVGFPGVVGMTEMGLPLRVGSGGSCITICQSARQA